MTAGGVRAVPAGILSHRAEVRRRRGTTASLACLTLALAGCSLVGGEDQMPGARAAAQAFAEAAQAGDAKRATFTDRTAAAAGAAFTAAYADAAGRRPTVSVQQVTLGEGGAKATASLHYSWTVRTGSPAWTYDTQLPLAKEGAQWRAEWASAALVPGLADGESLDFRTVRGRRGDILARDGSPLVTARPVVRVGIDKTRVDAATSQRSASALAKAAGEDPTAYAAQVAAAGPQAFVELIVLRTADPRSSALTTQAAAIPGAALIPEQRMLGPTATWARPILGSVGPATKEIVDASGGRIGADELVGLSGLEATQDELLGGTAGYEVRAVPAATPTGPGSATGSASPTGSPAATGPRVLKAVNATDGRSLQVTLDPALQTKAEATLAGVAPASALVVLRPSSGDVLAAASGPGSRGYSTALLGRYPPGSTFKVPTVLGLVRAGLTPTSTVDCPISLVVDGRTFKNHDAYPTSKNGTITLRTAFANSCNTALMGLAARLDQAGLADAADALGLGWDPGRSLGLEAFLGSVPREAGATEHAASMIGQGKVLTSPLGMATVAASVARGAVVRPRLLLPAAGGPTGTTDATGPTATPAPSASSGSSAPPPAKPLTAAEAGVLTDLMRAVVTEGNGTMLARVSEAPVAAKSGTAEFGDATPPKTHSWMIAIQGDLAVCVFVAEGEGGTATAAPLLVSFLGG